MTQILSGAVATGAGSVFTIPENANVTRWQVEVATTATVKIQGRAAPDAPWVDLVAGQTVSASGVVTGGWLRQIRANVTAWTAGAVNVWVPGANVSR